MWQVILWGAVAGSATLLGALTSLFLNIDKRFIGYIMALGTGALIGATTYELLGDALELGGLIEAAIGFLGGALLFTGLDFLISHKGGHERKTSSGSAKSQSGLAILMGTIMDAIPETAMLGVSVIEGGGVSLALLAAIFISNFPEGLSSSAGLKKGGFSQGQIILMWSGVLVISALSAWAGAYFLEEVSDSIEAIISAFAGGGIIAMVASTMMPEAYKEGGPAVGFITAVGVFITLLLNHL